MKTDHEDILDLFDYAWERFRDRMAGLSDTEWRWQPTKDDDLSLRWRLAHIAELLGEDRNGPMLGLAAQPTDGDTVDTAVDSVAVGAAAAALAKADRAYTRWRAQLVSVGDFGGPIGAAAGPYGDSTRRSFALHIVDELIHHAAEAALFRDLYAAAAR